MHIETLMPCCARSRDPGLHDWSVSQVWENEMEFQSCIGLNWESYLRATAEEVFPG